MHYHREHGTIGGHLDSFVVFYKNFKAKGQVINNMQMKQEEELQHAKEKTKTEEEKNKQPNLSLEEALKVGTMGIGKPKYHQGRLWSTRTSCAPKRCLKIRSNGGWSG